MAHVSGTVTPEDGQYCSCGLHGEHPIPAHDRRVSVTRGADVGLVRGEALRKAVESCAWDDADTTTTLILKRARRFARYLETVGVNDG